MNVKTFTNGLVNAIAFTPSGALFRNALIVGNIIRMLNAVGTNCPETTEYDSTLENAIMEYQRKKGLDPTGIFNDETCNALYEDSQKIMKDSIDEENDDIDYDEDRDQIKPHYDQFFTKESGKQVRQAHKDITIEFGDGQISKTIKDVIMRSVGVEIDTSGNPVSEVYEFIARDIIESDAPEDTYKYMGEEDKLSSPADIKYNFEGLLKNL